jgi:hypothetical protein
MSESIHAHCHDQGLLRQSVRYKLLERGEF